MGIMDLLEKLEDPVEEVIPETFPPLVEEPAEELPEVPQEEEYPPLDAMIAAAKPKKRLRPEWILGAVALLAAVVLGITLAISLPYMGQDEEDPDNLPNRHLEAEVTVPVETFWEPTISETEPENPTIPPERNPYDRYDFQYDRHNYLRLQNVTSYAGVDVSAYQGEIDWQKVKASGIDFAIIRLGYRGYESGKLVEDKYARDNLKNAKAAGLRIGAYFFSQALNISETDGEIAFMLEILGDTVLDMPIVLDWEIPASTARTASMDGQTLTQIQQHFCATMESKGYQPMIYFNWHQSENLYTLSELEDYPFWLALYQDRMTYPWRVEMWQWTSSGKVPGINADVDINVYMP